MSVPRILTHDEKKAADAAFAGRSFNPTWSASARAIYDGIVSALPQPEQPALSKLDGEPAGENSATSSGDLSCDTPLGESLADTRESQDVTDELRAVPTIRNRAEAIQAGVLIDVTPTARQLGLTFPVTITKPLWDLGIATKDSLSEDEQNRRLRDVLMAFRLKLASLVMISPLIDFPAMLTMPPGTVPQPIPLFAIVQPDDRHQATVTLLLPNEVSLSITPSN